MGNRNFYEGILTLCCFFLPFRRKVTAKTTFCADMEIKLLDVCFVYLMISYGSCMQYFISATVLED